MADIRFVKPPCDNKIRNFSPLPRLEATLYISTPRKPDYQTVPMELFLVGKPCNEANQSTSRSCSEANESISRSSNESISRSYNETDQSTSLNCFHSSTDSQPGVDSSKFPEVPTQQNRRGSGQGEYAISHVTSSQPIIQPSSSQTDTISTSPSTDNSSHRECSWPQTCPHQRSLGCQSVHGNPKQTSSPVCMPHPIDINPILSGATVDMVKASKCPVMQFYDTFGLREDDSLVDVYEEELDQLPEVKRPSGAFFHLDKQLTVFPGGVQASNIPNDHAVTSNVQSGSSNKSLSANVQSGSPHRDLRSNVQIGSPNKNFPRDISSGSPHRDLRSNVYSGSPHRDILSDVQSGSPNRNLPSDVQSGSPHRDITPINARSKSPARFTNTNGHKHDSGHVFKRSVSSFAFGETEYTSFFGNLKKKESHFPKEDDDEIDRVSPPANKFSTLWDPRRAWIVNSPMYRTQSVDSYLPAGGKKKKTQVSPTSESEQTSLTPVQRLRGDFDDDDDDEENITRSDGDNIPNNDDDGSKKSVDEGGSDRLKMRRHALAQPERMIMSQATREKVEKEVEKRKTSMVRRFSQFFNVQLGLNREEDLI